MNTTTLPEIGTLLTTREVARLRGATSQTVYNHVKLGTINPPAIKAGHGRTQSRFRVDEKMLAWFQAKPGDPMTRRRVAALEKINGQGSNGTQDAPQGDGAAETLIGRVRPRVSTDVLTHVRERLIYWRGFAEGTGTTYGAGETLLKAVVDLEAAIGVGQ